MKKLIALMLALILMLCIVACDSGNSGDSKETTGSTEESGGGNDETTGGTNGSDGDGETTAGDDVTTSGEGGNVKEPVLQDAVTVDETVYLAVDGAAYTAKSEATKITLAPDRISAVSKKTLDALGTVN